MAELGAMLLQFNLALALAIAVAAISRPVGLRLFGPKSAYLRWLLVPAAIAAVLLPRPETTPAFLVLPLYPDVELLASQYAASGEALTLNTAPAGAELNTELWLMALWIAGAFLAFALLALAQREFRRSLGQLVAASEYGGEVYRTARPIAGPFLIDATNPRIIIPEDFEESYGAEERALVLLHERLHLKRYDLHVRYFAAFLVCLCWFNPFAYLGWTMIRLDQELACDAEVTRIRPDMRKVYGLALLRTVAGQQRSPLACTLHQKSAIGERIGQISRAPVGAFRTALGIPVTFLLVASCSAFAWAQQPAGVGEIVSALLDKRLLDAQARLADYETEQSSEVGALDKIVLSDAMMVEVVASERNDTIIEYGEGVSLDRRMGTLTISADAADVERACSNADWPADTPVVRLATPERVKLELYGAIYLQAASVDDLALRTGGCSTTVIPGRIVDLSFIGTGNSRSVLGRVVDSAIILQDAAALSMANGGNGAQIKLGDISSAAIGHIGEQSRVEAAEASIGDVGQVGAQSVLISTGTSRVLANDLGRSSVLRVAGEGRVVLDQALNNSVMETHGSGAVVAEPGAVEKERLYLRAKNRLKAR